MTNKSVKEIKDSNQRGLNWNELSQIERLEEIVKHQHKSDNRDKTFSLRMVTIAVVGVTSIIGSAGVGIILSTDWKDKQVVALWFIISLAIINTFFTLLLYWKQWFEFIFKHGIQNLKSETVNELVDDFNNFGITNIMLAHKYYDLSQSEHNNEVSKFYVNETEYHIAKALYHLAKLKKISISNINDYNLVYNFGAGKGYKQIAETRVINCISIIKGLLKNERFSSEFRIYAKGIIDMIYTNLALNGEED